MCLGKPEGGCRGLAFPVLLAKAGHMAWGCQRGTARLCRGESQMQAQLVATLSVFLWPAQCPHVSAAMHNPQRLKLTGAPAERR